MTIPAEPPKCTCSIDVRHQQSRKRHSDQKYDELPCDIAGQYLSMLRDHHERDYVGTERADIEYPSSLVTLLRCEHSDKSVEHANIEPSVAAVTVALVTRGFFPTSKPPEPPKKDDSWFNWFK